MINIKADLNKHKQKGIRLKLPERSSIEDAKIKCNKYVHAYLCAYVMFY